MREMKNSHTEWLEEIPSDWELSNIASLYSVRNEKVSDKDYPPLSVTMKGVVPQLDTAAKTDAHDDRKLVRKGDFAINSRSDRRGSCGIADRDGSVSLINTILAPRSEMNPNYYNWLFHTSQFADEFYRWGHGIVDDLWTTRWQEMKRIDVPVPAYSEQEKIASTLDSECRKVDVLIANQEAQLEKLKAYKQSLITEVVTKGLDPNVPMKDSGVEWIGEIPESWNVIGIKYTLDRNHPYPIGDGDHGLIGPSDYLDNGIPYIRVQNLGWGTELLLDNLVYISEENNNRIKNSTLRPNDILFAKTGATIGKTGMIPPDMPISNTTSHVGKLTIDDMYNPRYVFYVLSSYIGFHQFWEIACQNTTRPELGLSKIRSICLLIPKAKSMQDEIVSFLDEKLSKADRLIQIKQAKIEKLNQYKKSIIYEYVTGKKEVVC